MQVNSQIHQSSRRSLSSKGLSLCLFFHVHWYSFRLLAGPLTPRLLEWLANWLLGLIVPLLIHHPYSLKRHILKTIKVVCDFINNFSYQRVSHSMKLLCSHMGRLTFRLSFAILSPHWPHNYHSSSSPGISSLPTSPWGNSLFSGIWLELPTFCSS